MGERLAQETLAPPHLPSSCPTVSTDGMSLQLNVEHMKTLGPNQGIRQAALSLLERWHKRPESVQPIASIRAILDTIRELPRSDERVDCMNSFLRVFGQPEHFATLLDMVRDSSQRIGTPERALSENSRKSSKHAVYGWCGQTRLALSGTEPTRNTLPPEPGVQEFLGKTPTSAWSLSMHIWQPNGNAKGFSCGRGEGPPVIAEPPHSHPFDFASTVVIGEMHQSMYAQRGSDKKLPRQGRMLRGRYDGVTLNHVHGVWPPHDQYGLDEVATLEDRVSLQAGDSYFMSAPSIHDVQIDVNRARSTPAITLFLRSETYVKPHVYMASSMAEFHAINPDIKHQGYPLSEEDWSRKLELVADYVRGKSPTLNLDSIVKFDSEYGFFHV